MEMLANQVAKWLQANLDLDRDKTEVVEYALITLFLFVITLLLIILFCWALGVLKEGLITALTIVIFRAVTGGAHLDSPWKCAFFSALVPVGAGYISFHFAASVPAWMLGGVLFIVSGWGLYNILRYAPVDSAAKPIRPEKRRGYRRLGIIITIIWSILIVSGFLFKMNSYILASILGFSWQILTLTPVGFLIYTKILQLGLKEGKK